MERKEAQGWVPISSLLASQCFWFGYVSSCALHDCSFLRAERDTTHTTRRNHPSKEDSARARPSTPKE